jgi:lysozyme family protein
MSNAVSTTPSSPSVASDAKTTGSKTEVNPQADSQTPTIGDGGVSRSDAQREISSQKALPQTINLVRHGEKVLFQGIEGEGEGVTHLQKELNEWLRQQKKTTISESGTFDADTTQAVKDFQSWCLNGSADLKQIVTYKDSSPVDGLVGPRTVRALEKANSRAMITEQEFHAAIEKDLSRASRASDKSKAPSEGTVELPTEVTIPPTANTDASKTEQPAQPKSETPIASEGQGQANASPTETPSSSTPPQQNKKQQSGKTDQTQQQTQAVEPQQPSTPAQESSKPAAQPQNRDPLKALREYWDSISADVLHRKKK